MSVKEQTMSADEAEEENVLCQEGYALMLREDLTPEEAEAFREKCQKAGNVIAEATALQAMCMAYYDQWRLEECLATAREAQTLFERAKDPAGQAHALLSIADVRLAMAWGHDVARRSAQKARKLFKQAGEGYEFEELRAAVVECQARVSVLKERPVHVHTEKAWSDTLKSAEEAEDLARGLGDLGLAASALCAAAEVHAANKRFRAATRAATTAADLYRNAGGPPDVVRALLLAVEANLGAGKRKEARKLASAAKDLAKQAKDAGLEEEAGKALERAGQDALLENLMITGGESASPQPQQQQEKEEAEPQTTMDLVPQVLGLDVFGTQVGFSPLMHAGVPVPMQAMNHDQFLSLGAGSHQASSILALMKSTAAETAHLRPTKPTADKVPTSGKGAAAGSIWVAPVRKRMETGVRWRAPDVRQGVSLASLPRVQRAF